MNITFDENAVPDYGSSMPVEIDGEGYSAHIVRGTVAGQDYFQISVYPPVPEPEPVAEVQDAVQPEPVIEEPQPTPEA